MSKGFVINADEETIRFENSYTSDGRPFVLVQLCEDSDSAGIEFKARDILAELQNGGGYWGR
jgi:hypothetical protein